MGAVRDTNTRASHGSLEGQGSDPDGEGRFADGDHGPHHLRGALGRHEGLQGRQSHEESAEHSSMHSSSHLATPVRHGQSGAHRASLR